jgi:hypothetical protein
MGHNTESGFAIQVCEGEDTFTIVVYDMDHLSSVALACRTLRDLARTSPVFIALRFF